MQKLVSELVGSKGFVVDVELHVVLTRIASTFQDIPWSAGWVSLL